MSSTEWKKDAALKRIVFSGVTADAVQIQF